MKMRIKPLLLGLCGLFTTALGLGSAHATVVLAYDLPGLVSASNQIVRGRVQSQNSRWDQAGKHIITEVVIAVDSRFKGAPNSTVTIQRLGGTVGDITQKVVGEASFSIGEEVFLFLRDYKMMPSSQGSNATQGGTRTFSSPVGMAQGKLHVVRTQGQPPSVQFRPEGMTAAVKRPGASISLLAAKPTETPLDDLEATVRELVAQGDAAKTETPTTAPRNAK